MNEIKLGRYKHYKGNFYQVVGFAKHSETLEDMVVYRALYGEGGTWVRPASMWNEIVSVGGKNVRRFEYVDSSTIEQTIEDRINKAQAIHDRLINCEAVYFANLKFTTLEQTGGVYVIFNKTDKAIYVGRTKNLRQRLYNNHLHGPISNARLKKYLIGDTLIEEATDLVSAKKWIKENCYIKYIKEPDYLERGKIEGLLGFILDVRYIDEEH